jgi:hypothetical protein
VKLFIKPRNINSFSEISELKPKPLGFHCNFLPLDNVRDFCEQKERRVAALELQVNVYKFQSLRLALSKAPNRVGVSPHLRMETDPVSETSCFSSNFLESVRWTKSENPVILCVIHNRQNPVESAYTEYLKYTNTQLYQKLKSNYTN